MSHFVDAFESQVDVLKKVSQDIPAIFVATKQALSKAKPDLVFFFLFDLT